MKHLLTAIACFFALSMSAQEALPWNPNANNDNIIGTVDLLAMLNVYGEEYSVETCFRGEPYYLPVSDYGLCNWYIPADCGLFLRYDVCACPFCFNRLPSEANEGDVIYGMVRRQYYYNDHSVYFQTFQDGEWTTFFAYNIQGDHLVKFTFDGTTWSGGLHDWTTLYPVEE